MGQPNFIPQKLIEEATATEQSISAWADLVNKGTVGMNNVPAEMQNAVVEQLSTMEAPAVADKTTQDFELKEIDGKTYKFNKRTGSAVPLTDT
jgi:hypothetical protein